MPWSTIKERIVSLGVPKANGGGAPSANDDVRETVSNVYEIQSDLPCHYKVDFESTEDMLITLQYGYDNFDDTLDPDILDDGVNWLDGNTVNADKGVALGPARAKYIRFVVKVTESTPTEIANVIITLSVFGKNKSGGGISIKKPKEMFSINIGPDEYRLFKKERVNMLMFGDSYSHLNNQYFYYGMMRKWRPEKWAGSSLPLSEGNAASSGMQINGPASADGSGEASENITGLANRDRPDPEQSGVLEINRGTATKPTSANANMFQMKDTDGSNSSGSETTGHRLLLINPLKGQFDGSSTPTLYQGSSASDVNDIPFVQADYRVSLLVHASKDTAMEAVVRPMTAEADPSPTEVSLKQGFNIVRLKPQTATANFDATADLRHTFFSRMSNAADESISILSVAMDSEKSLGIKLDYVGGGGWSHIDHNAESPTEARTFSFADGGSRKSYYLNKGLQEAIKFHEPNVAWVLLGANFSSGTNDTEYVEGTRARIESNSRAVGFSPRFLFIHTIGLGAQTGDRSRLRADTERVGSGDMVINLHDMIQEKYGNGLSVINNYMKADNIHPNQAGADEFAEMIWSRIEAAKPV